MKNRLNLIISILLTTPVLVLARPVIVRAVDDTSSDDTTTTAETETDSSRTDKKTLKERLADRKEKQDTKLAEAEQTRLKARCKAAQTGGLGTMHNKLNGLTTSRNKVYGNLVERLEKLVEKLKAKEVDTTDLEAQIAVLKTKIATFKTDLAELKEAVADLKEMDCVADPDGFKASLEAARALRETVAKDAKDIKTYVNDTIRQTLKTIKTQLEAKEAESESSEEGQ